MARAIWIGVICFWAYPLVGCTPNLFLAAPGQSATNSTPSIAVTLLLVFLGISSGYVLLLRQHNRQLRQEINHLRAQPSENELRLVEHAVQKMFENSAIGMGLLSLERRIIQLNPAVAQMSGYTQAELLGLSPLDLVHPDDRQLDTTLFQELIAGQRDTYGIERRYVRKDGSLFWAKMNYTLIRTQTGLPLYIFGTLEDIDAQKRAVLELQESEARFRSTFENTAIGMGLLSLEGHVLRANPAICAISGYTEAELKQRSDSENIYPADREVDRDFIQQLMRGEREAYMTEKRYIRKNGEVFWTRVNFSLVRGPAGEPRYLIGMLEDIDAQKKMWAELCASEERFRAMFESSAIGIALTTLDGRLLKANNAICQMSGYTETELQARNDALNTYPEDRAVATEQVGELVSGQRSALQLEKRYVRKNGEVFWARVTLSAVRGTGAQPVDLVAMVEDIDAQKKLWAELQGSKARFQAIYENAAVGIALLSLGRQVLAINPVVERIIGYPFDELIAIDPRRLAITEDQTLDAHWFEELVTGQTNAYVMERRYRRKDGRVIWLRINYSLVRNLAGQPDYLIGTIEDIDEQKRAAERLAAQEAEHRRLLEQRVAERTEELKQINQLLQQKAAQEAVVNERTRLARDLHDAVTQTLFAATLIADVLPDIWKANPTEGLRRIEELRQLTRGALAEMRTLLMELRPNALVETPLSTLLRQLTEALAGRARVNIQLNVEGDYPLPPDVKIALYRVTQEALNNIVKHARASQAIVALRLGRPVRLTLADNGLGFKLDTTTGDHLGLKIMRERAEAIGAKLSVYSEPGEGTQISITWEETA